MVNFTSSPSASIDSNRPIRATSTRPSSHSADGTIANATTTGAITLGPAGEYEITIISTVIVENPPHIIYVRNSGSGTNIAIFGVPVGGERTKRFLASEASLQIVIRNNNSSGVVHYGIVKID